jgi:hypothetical protein
MNRTIFILLFLTFSAYAQKRELVAVINAVDDGSPRIEYLELIYLTDKLREIASNILSKSDYDVMTNESVLALFETVDDFIKECDASTCLVDLGRRITADYIVQGRLGRFGGGLTIKVELYNTKRASLVASLTGDSKDMRGLLSILEAKAPDMFKRMQAINFEETRLAKMKAELEQKQADLIAKQKKISEDSLAMEKEKAKLTSASKSASNKNCIVTDNEVSCNVTDNGASCNVMIRHESSSRANFALKCPRGIKIRCLRLYDNSGFILSSKTGYQTIPLTGADGNGSGDIYGITKEKLKNVVNVSLHSNICN